MKIINAHDEAKTNFKNLYVSACIGNFDGVHKGHQELIAKTVKSAKENNGISIAITFNHNTKILNNEKKFLTTKYEKTSIQNCKEIQQKIVSYCQKRKISIEIIPVGSKPPSL